jgi:hypothetical protein
VKGGEAIRYESNKGKREVRDEDSKEIIPRSLSKGPFH